MITLFATAFIAAFPSPCSPPEGTAALLDRPEKIIVVGELHGTTEVPVAFAGLVCEAANQSAVTVALELPETDQSLLDAVMTAPDEETATRFLMSGDFGDPRRADGRHSAAMFQMIIDIWKIRATGRDVEVRAFQPRLSVIRGRDQAWWELEMAYGVSRALVARPHARLFVLTGNIHARRTASQQNPRLGVPAAGLLHRQDTLSLVVASQGGSSWNCRPECGSHRDAATDLPEARGVILGNVMEGAYDGQLAVGPTTASPPRAFRSDLGEVR